MPAFKVMAVKQVGGVALYGIGATQFPIVAEATSYGQAASAARLLNRALAAAMARPEDLERALAALGV